MVGIIFLSSFCWCYIHCILLT